MPPNKNIYILSKKMRNWRSSEVSWGWNENFEIPYSTFSISIDCEQIARVGEPEEAKSAEPA